MICRQVLLRCLPKFRHQVGSTTSMWICQMDNEVCLQPEWSLITWQMWRYWKWLVNNKIPCSRNTLRYQRYPDFGYRRDEQLETIEWKNEIPPFDGEGWHRMKTINADSGCLYRSEVKWIKFIRNSWSHLIRVEFEYKMEVYNDWSHSWAEC